MNTDIQTSKGSIWSRHSGFGRRQIEMHGTKGLVDFPAGESRFLLNCFNFSLSVLSSQWSDNNHLLLEKYQMSTVVW